MLLRAHSILYIKIREYSNNCVSFYEPLIINAFLNTKHNTLNTLKNISYNLFLNNVFFIAVNSIKILCSLHG
jgi:hypothetical protein